MKTLTKVTTTLAAVILAALTLTGASTTPAHTSTPVTIASCEANECHAGSIDFYSGLALSTPLTIASVVGSGVNVDMTTGSIGGGSGSIENLPFSDAAIGDVPLITEDVEDVEDGKLGGGNIAVDATPRNTPASDAITLSKALKTGFSEKVVTAHPYALTCLTPKADGTYTATYVFTKDGFHSDFSAVRKLAKSDFCLPSVTYPTQTIEEQSWSPSYSVVKQEFESARLVYSQDRNGLLASTVYSATDTAPSPELAETVSKGFGGNPAFYVVTSTKAVVLK